MKTAFALSAAAAFSFAGAVMAFPSVSVDLSGLSSNGYQFDASNDTIVIGGFNIGDVITDVDYDVNYTPVTPSWSEEARYSMYDGSGTGGTNFATALQYAGSLADSNPYAGAGNHDIADYVMTSSDLTIELHEVDFDDIFGGADANYGAGSTLTINYVPAPAGLALLGIAGLVGRRRRR